MKTTAMVKSWAAGVTVLAAIAALAGCQPAPGSQTSAGATSGSATSASAGGPTTIATTSAPSASASAAPNHSAPSTLTPSSTAANSNSATPTSAAPGSATANCAAGQVSVNVTNTQADAGRRRMTLVFTNRGSAACVLAGYPAVAIISNRGGGILKAQRGSNGYAPVQLAPGGKALAYLEWEGFPADGTDPNPQNCPGMAGRRLLVTPPNTTRSASFSVPADVCWGLSVGPVVPGDPAMWSVIRSTPRH